MKAMAIDVEYIRSLFEYGGDNLSWKSSGHGNRIINRPVGVLDKSNGYMKVTFQNKKYYLHRIIYALHHGIDPGGMIVDHINGNRLDNRISNLRLATKSQNGRNRKNAQSNSSTKAIGVTLSKRQRDANSPYIAVISISRNKTIYLGRFPNLGDASNAYQAARLKYFGEFA